MHFKDNPLRWESKVTGKEVKAFSIAFSKFELMKSYELTTLMNSLFLEIIQNSFI